MKKMFFLLCLTVIGLISFANSGPGDTIRVQTFSFDSISTRRAVFQFPEAQSWNKILMYYTLKCDDATPYDSYPCGEWDYTTFTNVYEHTGMLDSTEYTHPEYTLNNMSFDEFEGTNNPKYHSFDIQYQNSEYNFTASNENTVGTFFTNSGIGFTPGENDSRTLNLFRADSLINNGVTTGEIAGIKLFSATITPMDFPLVFRVAQTSDTALHYDTFRNLEFASLYEGLYSYDGSGEIYIPFTEPFLWDGTSNLVFDISLSNMTSNLLTDAYEMSYATQFISYDKDFYLDFQDFSYIEAPASALNSINSEITICCWVYGDSVLQAQNDYLFEAIGTNGERQMCVHYPWSNANIYWDCGNDGSGYDRIYHAADESEYKGQWNHLAFIKNSNEGSMKIYINGELWHSETGKSKNIENIERFIIGSGGNPSIDRSYDGGIDDFSVWKTELNQSQIQTLMNTEVDWDHPNYSDLVLLYDFNETPGSGNLIEDKSSNQADGSFLGTLNRKSYQGRDRFKAFKEFYYAPVIRFLQGDFTFTTSNHTYTDSIMMNQQIILQYENLDPYTIQCIDTSLYFNHFDLSTDIEGNTDTSFYTADISIQNDNLTYYGESFEVINTIQLQNYVTPYGINLNLGTDGFTWVYDVTDYQNYLHDMVDISSHNTQELLDLSFIFIEGEPVREVLSFDQVYIGNYGHHNIASDISLTPTKLKKHPEAEMIKVKTRTTGHGMEGAGNCAEFCPTTHHLDVEGSERYAWQNWTECSTNPVYPQGGTWIFDRAGWCPGSFADTYDWDITEYVTDEDSISIDYGMTEYPSSEGEGNYQVSVQLVQYSSPNFEHNASIDDVLAPNNHDLHNRYNPVCNNPEVRIQNNGSETLTSLSFEYGINGNYSYTYDWNGNLEFLEKEIVSLPVIDWNEFTNDNSFNVRLTSPNGNTDEFEHDNTFITSFEAVDIWTDTIMLIVKTNNFGEETHYQIKDHNGNILVDRDNLEDNTYYYDTLGFPPGCYELQLYDDGEDGLNFWYYNGADGTGFAKLRYPGAQYVKHFRSDFGSFINYQFIIPDQSYIINEELKKTYFDIYPNPSSGQFNIKLKFKPDLSTQIQIFDMYGKTVWKISGSQIRSDELSANLSDLCPGIYYANLQSGNINRTIKLVIQ